MVGRVRILDPVEEKAVVVGQRMTLCVFTKEIFWMLHLNILKLVFAKTASRGPGLDWTRPADRSQSE